MLSKYLFDRRYGNGAFARLRSMLDDPTFAYQFGLDNVGENEFHERGCYLLQRPECVSQHTR